MPGYTEIEVRLAVAQARSYSGALRALGLRPAGGNHATLKRMVVRYGISTAHFDPHTHLLRNLQGPAAPLSELLVEGSTYHRGNLKRRLFAEGLKTNRCELCGQGEDWRGGHMALILDHINGESTDNRLDNLRIVCPNCAATFDTHCGRKNRPHAAARLCEFCAKEFYPADPVQRFCSRGCGSRGGRRKPHNPAAWKVPHPPHDQLKREVVELGFLATGRKYGVSDNAIRKWLRHYEKYGDLPPPTTINP